MTGLRLQSALEQQLQSFVATASQPSFVPCARAARAEEQLRTACEALVHDALMLKARRIWQPASTMGWCCIIVQQILCCLVCGVPLTAAGPSWIQTMCQSMLHTACSAV